MSAPTSPLAQVEEAASAAVAFRLDSSFHMSDGTPFTLSIWGSRTTLRTDWWGTSHIPSSPSRNRQFRESGLALVIQKLAAAYPNSNLDPDSIRVVIRKGPMTALKLTPLVEQAWREAFGQAIPTLVEIAERKKVGKAAKQSNDERMLALLKSGPDGVTKFNELPRQTRAAADFRKADLAGVDLSGASLAGADFSGADFSGSSLVCVQGSDSHGCGLGGASFVGADLSKADFRGGSGVDADFTRAVLKGTTLYYMRLAKAKFVEADLTGASLTGSDLRGADFTDARLDGAKLTQCKFDEHTRWPKGFKIPADLEWKGTGADPRQAPTRKERKSPPPTDFAGFLERLKTAADPAKLDKATAMLKADRFRLFAKVEDDQLVGVVKSQSDPDLVYSCRLDHLGNYSCCTQNLNVCGGLRGSPCKHLLVLIVGLAKAGELDAATAHEWTQSSRGRKPALDKDAMAEVLLQYKGAEAGEVDWRPTETIPEDFYAM